MQHQQNLSTAKASVLLGGLLSSVLLGGLLIWHEQNKRLAGDNLPVAKHKSLVADFGGMLR